jgi:UDP-4-amino-4-deoxy-L-arabinose-oxoglutarate aminotransferase
LSVNLTPVSMTTTPQPFLPFARPDIGEQEISAVVECLRSGWLTTGPRTKEFERRFADVVQPGAHALAVNSATAGLHLALEAVGVSPGDEVIVPDYTFTASAEVVRYLGADPVFVEVDPCTLNVTAERLEAVVTPRTKVIMPVHFAGLACDMDSILAMARRHRVAVVDDAAHALPSTFGGRMVGGFETDASVFSFYANKTLSTGEGGMVVTGRSDVATRCGIMRLHGISRDAFARYVSTTPACRRSWIQVQPHRHRVRARVSSAGTCVRNGETTRGNRGTVPGGVRRSAAYAASQSGAGRHPFVASVRSATNR